MDLYVISSRIVSATRLLIKMHGAMLSAACTELLLMMNIYLFETRGG
jgi:hypothetical protein